jgi:hypothetical protein
MDRAVAFAHFRELPPRQNIRNAAIRFNPRQSRFPYKPAVAADH